MNKNSVITSYEVVPLETLKPYHDNPRVGDIDKIAASLKANKQYRALVVDSKTREVLAGNHTFMAAKALGWDVIDVGWIDVDEAAAKRIVLVDNRLSDDATYNDLLLAAILGEIREEDEALLIGTGYSSEEVDELLADVVLENFGQDEENEEEVSQVAAMLNRLMPTTNDRALEDAAENNRRLIESAERAAEMRARTASSKVEVFVIFQFGELRAKVTKEGYDKFVNLYLEGQDGDLMAAGMAAARSLGVEASAVLPAMAQGTERWL